MKQMTVFGLRFIQRLVASMGQRDTAIVLEVKLFQDYLEMTV